MEHGVEVGESLSPDRHGYGYHGDMMMRREKSRHGRSTIKARYRRGVVEHLAQIKRLLFRLFKQPVIHSFSTMSALIDADFQSVIKIGR